MKCDKCGKTMPYVDRHVTDIMVECIRVFSCKTCGNLAGSFEQLGCTQQCWKKRNRRGR